METLLIKSWSYRYKAKRRNWLLLDNTCGRRSHTMPGCFTQLRKKRIKTLLLRKNSLQCYYLQPRTKRLFSLKKNNIKKKHSQAIFFSACSPTNTSTCSPFFSSFKQVYICGGFNGNECLSTAEVYDATTDQWTFISPMRSRRSGVGVIAYGKQVYAVR